MNCIWREGQGGGEIEGKEETVESNIAESKAKVPVSVRVIRFHFSFGSKPNQRLGSPY